MDSSVNLREEIGQEMSILIQAEEVSVLASIRKQNQPEILENLDLHREDIQVIRNIYWEQSACMRKVEFNEYIQTERGLRRG